MTDVTRTEVQAPIALPVPIPAPVHQGVVPLPAAGWYVDPYHPDLRRWWNGTEWTDHVRVAVGDQEQPAVAIPGVVMLPAAPAPQRDTRSSIRDLAEALSTAQSRRTRVIPVSAPQRRRPSVRSLVIAAVTIVVVAALGVVAWWVIAHPGLLSALGVHSS